MSDIKDLLKLAGLPAKTEVAEAAPTDTRQLKAGVKSIAEAQSAAQKAAFQKMLAKKKGAKPAAKDDNKKPDADGDGIPDWADDKDDTKVNEDGSFNKDGSYNTSDDEATEFDEFEFDDDGKAGMDEASTINGRVQRNDELVWKQTSMSYEQAVEKYGKEHVKLGGKNRRGDDTVEVHVPLVDESDYMQESQDCKTCGEIPCVCPHSISESPTMDTTQLIELMKLSGITEENIQRKLDEWANTPEGVGEVEPTVHGTPDNYNFAQSVNLSLKRYLDAQDMKVQVTEHKADHLKALYEEFKKKK